MKQYIYTFIAVSVAGALSLAFNPGTIRTKRQFKLIVSLCMISILIIPLRNAYVSWNKVKGEVVSMFDVKTVNNSEDLKDISPSIIIEETKIRLEKEITDLIIQNYGYDNDTVQVKAELDTKDLENIKLLWIRVKIKESGGGDIKPSKIAEYLSHEVGVPAEVNFE